MLVIARSGGAVPATVPPRSGKDKPRHGGPLSHPVRAREGQGRVRADANQSEWVNPLHANL